MVENQLTATDHGHLGQLVTYAAGTEAQTVAWLATSFREEHRQAIDFLNQPVAIKSGSLELRSALYRSRGQSQRRCSKCAEPNDWHGCALLPPQGQNRSRRVRLLYTRPSGRISGACPCGAPGLDPARKGLDG